MAATKRPQKVIKRPRKKGRVLARLRDWEIMILREEGHSYREISEQMAKRGVQLTPESCRKIVVQTLENMAINLSETAEQVRQLEMNRLDSMLTIATKAAKSRGKMFNRLAAMDRVIKIGERKAKLLGLDAEKHEHEHNHTIRIYEGLESTESTERQEGETSETSS